MRPSQMRRMTGQGPDYDSEPPVPAIVFILIAINVGLYLLRFVLPFGVHEEFLRFFSIVPGRLLATPGGDVAGTAHEVLTFITHCFLHADFLHLLFNSVWLLAFGTLTASRLQAGRAGGVIFFLAFYLSAGVFSGIAFVLLNLDQAVLLLGASGALSALFAAAARASFNRHRLPDGSAAPLLALTDKRVVGVSLVYAVLNLALATPLGPVVAGPQSGDVAWQVHLAGFAYGLVMFPFFDHLAGNTARRQP